ncbi:interleukin-12 receptor subunit beta-1 isoform X2 [Penaeus vannamei]|uniref:interleukin-12 receptor subunit beta-1 isoform X2 n=1 Tax=Penaeus vannamei TaxID=6689 RepID=UPI00387F4C15
MKSLCHVDAWKTGLLFLLASHAASQDSRRSASILRNDFDRKVCDSPSPTSAEPVEDDLSCVSLSRRKLKCQWQTANQRDAKMYLYNYTPTWNPEDKNTRRPCTCVEDWCASCLGLCCLWKVSPYDPTAPEIMIVTATATQVCNVTFNHSIIVRPDPAADVKVNQTGSYRELEVSWETPPFLLEFQPGLFYSVGYRPKNVSAYGLLEWQNETGSYHGRSTTVRLASLHGGVDYEVRVRLRSGARPPPAPDGGDDGWWSTEASGNAVTLQGAPEVAPAVGVGTFEVESDADSGRRAVALQWRPVPALLHNGPGLEYRVLVTDRTNNTVRNLTENGASVRIDNLNENMSYRMEIVAANRAGVGLQTAAVRVPAAPPPAPLLQAVVYHAGTRRYELRWPAKENLTYTAYVCTDGLSSSAPCKSNLYWKNLGSASAVNLTLEELNVTDSVTPDEVRFALSAETFAEDSSGMAWDSCIHPQQYNTQHSAPEIITNYDSTTNSVSLRWRADCAARGGVIEEVQAIWCEGRDSCVEAGNGIPRKNESDVFSGVVVLEGLREGSAYTANLRLRYRDGLSGWSSPLPFATKSSALPTWLIVTIVIVAIAVTVVVLSAGVYSRRRIEVIVREVQREIILPEGLVDQHYLSERARERQPQPLDSRSNKNVQAPSSQVLPLDKMHLQSLSSGDRSRAQNNIEEKKILIDQNGYVLPVFNDVGEDSQRGVHKANNIPVFTSLPPSGYVEDSYGGLTGPNPSTSGELPPIAAARKSKPPAGHVAVEPRSSNVNINSHEKEGILVKNERGASPGYVVLPTKTSRDLGVVMDGGDQGKSSTGYASLPLVGLGTQTFQNLEENTEKDGQGISTNFVAFPAADFTTQASHGSGESIGKSSGYIAFPATNFATHTPKGLEDNSVRDEHGKSPGYIAFPAANFAMHTSKGLEENSVNDGHGKSTAYVSFPPFVFCEKSIRNSPSPSYIAFPPVGFGPHNP